MKNYIIFVIATFGGILALGLAANKVKSVRGSRTCWVQVEEGMKQVECEGESLSPEGDGDGDVDGVMGILEFSLLGGKCEGSSNP